MSVKCLRYPLQYAYPRVTRFHRTPSRVRPACPPRRPRETRSNIACPDGAPQGCRQRHPVGETRRRWPRPTHCYHQNVSQWPLEALTGDKPRLARQKLRRIPGRDPPGDSTHFLPSKTGFNHVLGPGENCFGSIFVNDLEALQDALYHKK